MIVGDPKMNRGTGFITLTLADICPPGWALPRPS